MTRQNYDSFYLKMRAERETRVSFPNQNDLATDHIIFDEYIKDKTIIYSKNEKTFTARIFDRQLVYIESRGIQYNNILS